MDMAPDSKELSQTDTQDLKARIGNLSQFLNVWKDLGKLTMPLVERGIGALPVVSRDQIPANVEKLFQDLKELLLRMYPRVRPDVRNTRAPTARRCWAPAEQCTGFPTTTLSSTSLTMHQPCLPLQAASRSPRTSNRTGVPLLTGSM